MLFWFKSDFLIQILFKLNKKLKKNQFRATGFSFCFLILVYFQFRVCLFHEKLKIYKIFSEKQSLVLLTKSERMNNIFITGENSCE